MNLEFLVDIFKGPYIWISVGVYLLLIWLGLVIFTWLDIKERTFSIFYRLMSLLLVLTGGVFGLMIYLLIRPKNLVSETAQKRMEERIMIKESIENICPQCSFVLEKDYIFCPNCSQSLKKVCLNCSRICPLNWAFCPNCSSKNNRAILMEDLKTLGIIRRSPGRPKKLLSTEPVPSRPRGRPRKINIDESTNPQGDTPEKNIESSQDPHGQEDRLLINAELG